MVFWKLVLHFRGDTLLSNKSVAIVEILTKVLLNTENVEACTVTKQIPFFFYLVVNSFTTYQMFFFSQAI